MATRDAERRDDHTTDGEHSFLKLCRAIPHKEKPVNMRPEGKKIGYLPVIESEAIGDKNQNGEPICKN